MDTAELESVSTEAGLLVDALRAKGVHAALSMALLDLYERGGRSGFHPSELLNELLSLFGQPRAPPVLSTLKLPLRQKDEFVNAIIAANLDGALRQGLIALECVGLYVALRASDSRPAHSAFSQERRAGSLEALEPAEVIGASAAPAARLWSKLRSSAKPSSKRR